MNKNSTILIVGHDDIIEKSLREYFQDNNYGHVFTSSQMGLDASIQASVYDFFQRKRPDYIFLGSTRSGGIEANQQHPADFIYHNTESQNNVVYAAWKFGIKKLLYIASSCVYPKDCRQPMREEDILSGPLENTSEAYALAKIAGIKLCQSYRKQYGLNAISVIPATVYGPHCNTAEESHVLGALWGKFQEAVQRGHNEVTVWGSGKPRREFIYDKDFVEACLFLMEKYDQPDPVNCGSGEEISIKDLAALIADMVGFKGKIIFDSKKPDGVAQKMLDQSRLATLGWKAEVNLKEGIR